MGSLWTREHLSGDYELYADRVGHGTYLLEPQMITDTEIADPVHREAQPIYRRPSHYAGNLPHK